MCYCKDNSSERNVYTDLVDDSIPDDCLVCSKCWKRICRLRGIYSYKVEPETWKDICGKRGYLLARQNPRGF